MAAILAARRVVQLSSIQTLTFEDALELALAHNRNLCVSDFENNPAALCVLSGKDERRIAAGTLLRQLIQTHQEESIQGEFFNALQHMGIGRLAAKSFWHAQEDLTKRWTRGSEGPFPASSDSKPCHVSRPVLFSIHIPRA